MTATLVPLCFMICGRKICLQQRLLQNLGNSVFSMKQLLVTNRCLPRFCYAQQFSYLKISWTNMIKFP